MKQLHSVFQQCTAFTQSLKHRGVIILSKWSFGQNHKVWWQPQISMKPMDFDQILLKSVVFLEIHIDICSFPWNPHWHLQFSLKSTGFISKNHMYTCTHHKVRSSKWKTKNGAKALHSICACLCVCAVCAARGAKGAMVSPWPWPTTKNSPRNYHFRHFFLKNSFL